MYRFRSRSVLYFVLLLPFTFYVSCGGSSGSGGSGNGFPIDLGPFISQARNADCSGIRNNLYVIDNNLVLWDRAGNCPDNSYSQTLYGRNIDQVLCKHFDSIAGPQTLYNDVRYKDLFDTVIANLDKPDLGLGAGHTVKPVTFVAGCNTNADCLSAEYCAKALGDCAGQGTCKVKPITCPLAPVSVNDLVCGCDGQTYGHYIDACDAAKAGVNIAHKGACP